MKKVISIVLLIAILFAGCQTKPADNPSAETPTPSAVTEETSGGTVTGTTNDETQTPTLETTPGKTESVETSGTTDDGTTPTSTATDTETSGPTTTGTTAGTSTGTSATASAGASTGTTAGTSTATKKPTATPTKTNKPISTPTATVTPKIKTFSIPVSVAGGVSADKTKINFKGYYKNNDEKSNTIIISQDATTSITLTGNTNWALSSDYSTYPKSLMTVKDSGLKKKTVNVTFKAGATVSVNDIAMAHFVYVPTGTENNTVINNGIPTMLINIESSTDYYNLTKSTDKSVKDIWSEGTYAIVEGRTKTYNTKDAQGSLRIKRRGWSSFDFDKKSYTVKLDDGKALLGMESNKDWVLAANHSDKSLMRNYFAYTVGQQLKSMWVPECNFIDVYITHDDTSDYLGTYLLVEKIEVAKEKINIQEMTEADTNIGSVTIKSPIQDALAGSFLVELESFDRASTGDMLINTVVRDETGGRYHLSVKSPDKDYFAPDPYFDPTRDWTWPDTHLATKNTKQADYIRSFFITVDDAIDTNDYATFSKYIDVDSFVDYYIINELAKNIDGNFRLSTYFYKDKGGKLKVTIWDFDIAFGNCNYEFEGMYCGPTDGLFIREKTSWYRHLFQSPEFCDKVEARWKELRKGVLSDSNMESMLTKQGNTLQKAADANFDRWPILGKEIWPNPSAIVRCDTYDENVDYLVDWLQERAAWLDRNM